MAGPHAAGVAALALSAHPDLSARARSPSVLERTAEPLPARTVSTTRRRTPNGVDSRPPATGGERNGFYGAGEVNALAAVQ